MIKEEQQVGAVPLQELGASTDITPHLPKPAPRNLMDAFDGISPPVSSAADQFTEHCFERAAGILRAENDDGKA